MTETEHVEKLKEGYRRWNDTRAGSIDYWLDMIADDVKWRSLSGGVPGLEFSKDCNCKDDVIGYFAQIGQDWEMIHYTAEEFIAQGDRIVVLSQCAWRSKKTGKEVESPKVDIFRLRDGKIVEFLEFYDSAKLIAATMAE